MPTLYYRFLGRKVYFFSIKDITDSITTLLDLSEAEGCAMLLFVTLFVTDALVRDAKKR